MYAPAPARIKKTDITRSRSGCARCRQKRRKCDETKPTCGRCVTTGSDCHYGGVTLKFREATQWAAQKVELGKGIIRSPPVAADTVDQRVDLISDESPASELANDSCLTDAPIPCEYTPPVSSLAEQNHAWAVVPELGVEAEGQSTDLSPLSGSPGAFESDVMAMSTSLIPTKWTDVQLDFDLLPDDDDRIFTQLLNLPQNFTEPRLAEAPWIGMRIQAQEAAEESPVSSRQRQTERVVARSNNDQTGFHVDEEPMMLDFPAGQQSPSTSTIGCHPPRGYSNVEEAETLPLAHLAWPKVNKPPPSKIPVSHRIYLAHFKVTMLQTFPMELPFLWDMVIAWQPVCCAALALAAANLANLQGKQLENPQGTWAAMPIHRAKAAAFSAQTIEALDSGSILSLDTRLVTMLLIVYYELEAGSFSNACHAISILNVTILSNIDAVLSLSEGCSLVRWWLHLRSLTASAQGPHTPYGPENSTEKFINKLELKVATGSQLIDLIGTRARRLWHRILVAKGFGTCGDTPATTMKRVDDWWKILKGNHLCGPLDDQESADRFLTQDELYAELRNLRTTLESCEAPSGFRPEFLNLGSSTEQIEPLGFSSHRRAMEVADYAFAQLLCDETLLRDLADHSTDLPRQFPNTSSNTTNPYVHIILRIAAGLDPSKCGRENAYRRGIISCLFFAGLFCPGQISSKIIKDTVSRMMDARIFFEGPFYPIRAFLGFLRALEREISNGRTIFFSCLAYDEWTTKDKLFSEGKDEHLITIGCEADGRYFNDLVPIYGT